MTKAIEEKIAKLETQKRDIETKIKECQEALERNKKPKLAIPFVPNKGEKYYFYIPDGSIYDIENKNNTEDIPLIELGGAFRTREESILAYEKRCAEIELLMMCDGLDIMEECVKVFLPRFDRDDEYWYADYWDTFLFSPYRFASEESCQSAIDKLGDRKLRLVFNIPLED